MTSWDGNSEATEPRRHGVFYEFLCGSAALWPPRFICRGLINEPRIGFAPNRRRQVIMDSRLGGKGNVKKKSLRSWRLCAFALKFGGMIYRGHGLLRVVARVAANDATPPFVFARPMA